MRGLRLLENYRSKKSYDLYVWEQRIDAYRKAAALASEYSTRLYDTYEVLEKMAAMRPADVSEIDHDQALSWCDFSQKFRIQIIQLIPFFTSSSADAVIEYMERVRGLEDIIKGKELNKPLSSKEEVSDAAALFCVKLSHMIADGEQYNPKNHAETKSDT